MAGNATVTGRSPVFTGNGRPPSYGQITLSAVEISWAAGLFDGEGTATICGGRRRLAVKMADEESVRRFHSAIGVGKVYGPYEHRTATLRDGCPRRPSFMWLATVEDADAAARLLLPWIGSEKAAAIDRVCGTSEIGQHRRSSRYRCSAPVVAGNASRSAAAAGSRSVKVVPPSPDSSSSVPPIASASSRAIARPRPLPEARAPSTR